MNNMKKCNLVIEFISNADIEELPPSLHQHIEVCGDCKEEWIQYNDMIDCCRSFPSIDVPLRLYQSLAAIQRCPEVGESVKRISFHAKYGELVAAAATIVLLIAIYIFTLNVDLPAFVQGVPLKIDRVSHKAYSEVVKAYHSKDALIGNIQYACLPITMKIQEVYSMLIKDKNEIPETKNIQEKSQEKEKNK
ncbi:MAG: hypothetical protein A2Y62_22270 [Candidatus Fischerbacteria bacterium RBG_13_37_8]|uniref:Zinc-finger domain-containing protein n=1 Tax=Candidatus Fischerbacteria bacterium RBG_13_37_8 TaxID=1817863 RepID=A0A1F5VJS4_9BACT|nr:MAG: hypothetical protein A2Y62_22270 [Candidatus Fischerbacteria bacterium RBG_13_37_8]